MTCLTCYTNTFGGNKYKALQPNYLTNTALNSTNTALTGVLVNLSLSLADHAWLPSYEMGAQ